MGSANAKRARLRKNASRRTGHDHYNGDDDSNGRIHVDNPLGVDDTSVDTNNIVGDNAAIGNIPNIAEESEPLPATEFLVSLAPTKDASEGRPGLRERGPSLSENITNKTFKSPLITGDFFKQETQLRQKDERKPMTSQDRFRKRLARWGLIQRAPSQDSTNHSAHSGGRKQYTVTTVGKKTNFKNLRTSFLARSTCQSSNPDDFAYAPSDFLVHYINWTFRSSFLLVFLSFTAIFFLLVFAFGLMFKWAGEAEPQCIIVAGDNFGEHHDTTFFDGYALSWTTFTTVGYGAVYTATGNDHGDQNSCIFITFLCTAESFIGLLYAGVCTAIMFGKVGRIQSHAQVTFSDTMCVEYGKTVKADASGSNRGARGLLSDRGIISAKGVLSEIEMDDAPQSYSEDEEISKDVKPPASQSSKKLLCPVLKFQLVNQLANQAGGEILDASISVMVRKEAESYPFEPIARFLRVDLEEPSHPFFNRVWHARHVLDDESPLVSVEARQMIRLNGGYWPESLNNPLKVREHLRFSSVIITMTGLSNICAESVQIARRYYLPDVLIGYNFAPLLFKDEFDRLLTDMTLINDVIEQQWSRAESLSGIERDRPTLRLNEGPSKHQRKRPANNALRSVPE